jgi:trbC/VIRB2 family
MKKEVKVLSIALIVLTVLLAISNIVLATDIPGKIDQIAQGNSSADTSKVVNLGATIVTIMQTVGIVVAVVVLLILGIKYMMGSAEEKAEYKKTMIPYLVGAILIFASTTIVNVVYNIANGFNATK